MHHLSGECCRVGGNQAPQQQSGIVEVWDWANAQMLQQLPVSCHATAMDFCYNDIALGDGTNSYVASSCLLIVSSDR
jgi:hypothetical protein